MSRRFTYDSAMTRGMVDARHCRATELSRLHALLDEALAGRPRLVLCSNEAWTGKTALLRQFTDEAARRGVRVVWPPSFGSPGRRRTGSGVTRWARQQYGGTREKSNNGPLASASSK